jgi:hypothetical protein
MSLRTGTAMDRNEHRARRWTVTIMAAVLLIGCALVAGVARGRAEAGRAPTPRHVAPASGGFVHQAAGVRRDRRASRCPIGGVPGVVIDDLRVRPALEDGFWLRPGHYRVLVRGHLVNDTNAAILMDAVRWTVGDRPWRARTHLLRAMRPDSSLPFVARGGLVSTKQERMALAARLSWGWRDPRLRPCGRSSLAEDD